MTPAGWEQTELKPTCPVAPVVVACAEGEAAAVGPGPPASADVLVGAAFDGGALAPLDWLSQAASSSASTTISVYSQSARGARIRLIFPPLVPFLIVSTFPLPPARVRFTRPEYSVPVEGRGCGCRWPFGLSPHRANEDVRKADVICFTVFHRSHSFYCMDERIQAAHQQILLKRPVHRIRSIPMLAMRSRRSWSGLLILPLFMLLLADLAGCGASSPATAGAGPTVTPLPTTTSTTDPAMSSPTALPGGVTCPPEFQSAFTPSITVPDALAPLPLPPSTREGPKVSSAVGDIVQLCSAGTHASIEAFLTTQTELAGWVTCTHGPTLGQDQGCLQNGTKLVMYDVTSRDSRQQEEWATQYPGPVYWEVSY